MNNKKNTRSFCSVNELATYLETWLKNKIKKTNSNGIVFGLSGGIDSAVVAAIAKKALDLNYLAVVMHINNSSLDKQCTDELISQLKINYLNLNLLSTANSLANVININPRKDLELFSNIKARLRMISLYTLAQKYNYLVCGTTNYDEWITGYFTKYADSACDISLLKNCLKSDIYKLAKFYNIPHIIINRAPSASLIPNQTDEKELKLKYFEIDNHYLKINELKNKKLKRLNELIKISKHKRTLPSVPKKILSIK